MPIMMGFILAFNVDKRSRFAGLLVITTSQTASIWNVGIKTAAAQNMVAIGFIEKQLKAEITWGEWFVAAAPFAALLTVALYFIMTRMMKPEMEEIAGGQETIRSQLAELGPMTAKEWRLLARHAGAAGLLGHREGAAQHRHLVDDHRRDRPHAAAGHRRDGLEDLAEGLPLGHGAAVRRRHQRRHGAAPDQGGSLAREPDRPEPRPRERDARSRS